MMRPMSRRLSLAFAALTLPLALLACSTDDDDRPAHLGSSGGSPVAGGGAGSGGQGIGGGGPSGGAPGSGGSTTGGAQGEGFAWPLEGTLGKDWIVANYVDRDASNGTLDFHGGSRTYDGHAGVDIAIPSFRFMDRGIAVHAVEGGTVEFVQDGYDDRSKGFDASCQVPANRVHVRHPDGRLGQYLHFRKDTIVVSEGQQVDVGDVLGEVGSSGCSDSPHVHFELHDANDSVVDTFEEGLWASPPPYDVPLHLMDVVIKESVLTLEEVWDPAPNASQFSLGVPMGFAVTTGGALPGDALEVSFRPEGGAVAATLSHEYDGTESLYSWYWDVTLNGSTGPWSAEVRINDESVGTYELEAQ